MRRTSPRRPRIDAFFATAVLLWLTAIVAGAAWAARFEVTPGTQGVAPGQWPAASSMPWRNSRGRIVMFVHPLCACTDASLEGLEDIVRRERPNVDTFVVMIIPDGAPASWQHADQWQRAGRIPGVTRVVDINGVEARRFGAETSGHVVYYDAERELQFSGGITAARGNVGDSVGLRALVAAVASRVRAIGTHSVFGCPLQAP